MGMVGKLSWIYVHEQGVAERSWERGEQSLLACPSVMPSGKMILEILDSLANSSGALRPQEVIGLRTLLQSSHALQLLSVASMWSLQSCLTLARP